MIDIARKGKKEQEKEGKIERGMWGGGGTTKRNRVKRELETSGIRAVVGQAHTSLLRFAAFKRKLLQATLLQANRSPPLSPLSPLSMCLARKNAFE